MTLIGRAQLLPQAVHQTSLQESCSALGSSTCLQDVPVEIATAHSTDMSSFDKFALALTSASPGKAQVSDNVNVFEAVCSSMSSDRARQRCGYGREDDDEDHVETAMLYVYTVSHRISHFHVRFCARVTGHSCTRVSDSYADSNMSGHGFDSSRSARFRVVTRRALRHGCFTANASGCLPVPDQLD